MAEDKIQETSVIPVNELGEWVFEPGVGTNNVVGYLPTGFYPTNVETGKIAVAGVSGFKFEYPVKLATFGDSLTDTSDAATHDLSAVSTPLFNDKSLGADRLACGLLFHSRGMIIPVANCGKGGTRSDQIVARDLDPVGVNRRGLQDAANLGAKVVVISLGRNDVFNVIRANSTEADKQAVLDTIYANIVTAVRRAQRLGLYPILREFAGYFYEDVSYNYAKIANFTPEDVKAQLTVLNRAAEHIIKNIVPTLGDMKVLYIRKGMVDPVTGEWYKKYSTDGLHENVIGSRVITKRLIALIASMTRPVDKTLYAPLPTGSGRMNGFTNAALLPPYTNGAVAGINAFVDTTGGNGATVVASVTTDPDGRVWQDFIITPTGFTGSPSTLAPNGLSTAFFYVRFGVTGATPTLALQVGDIFRQEFDVIIDDGAGNPPSVLSWGVSSRLEYNAGQAFTHYPIARNTAPVTLSIQDEVVDGKVISLPVVSPAASADITNAFLSLATYAGSNKPYRVRIGAPRMVKYNPQ